MVRFFLFVCFYSLAFSSFLSVAAAQDLSQVKQEIVQLSDTVYLIVPNPPYGGNLAVSVGDDGILLVDDQMMPMTPGIREAIASLQEGREVGARFIEESGRSKRSRILLLNLTCVFIGMERRWT